MLDSRQKSDKGSIMTTEAKADDAAPVKRDADNRVYIFDTTLRDGEQSPGASMTLEERLQVAELLDEMGVDIIEAGLPIPSNEAFPVGGPVVQGVDEAGIRRLGGRSEGRGEHAHPR